MSSGEHNALKLLTREYLQLVWETSKVDVHSLSPDDQLLCFIMREHEEYHEYWENFDKWREHEFDPESEVNPYLHVALHHIVESQIRNEDPPEVEKVYQALKDRGLSRQDALHQIAAVFLEHLLQVLQHEREFDPRAYLSDLIRLPQKI